MPAYLAIVLLLSASSPAYAGPIQSAMDEGSAPPKIEQSLRSAGWTPTPDRSASYAVGDIRSSSSNRVIAFREECFDGVPREAAQVSLEVVQSMKAGGRVPLGVARVEAEGVRYKQVTFAEPYVTELSEMTLLPLPTCAEALAKRNDIDDLYVIQALLSAEVKERICTELSAGASGFGAKAEGEVSRECTQGSEGHVAVAFRQLPVSALTGITQRAAQIEEETREPDTASQARRQRWSASVPGQGGFDVYGPFGNEASLSYYVDNRRGCISQLVRVSDAWTERMLAGAACEPWQTIDVAATRDTLTITADGSVFPMTGSGDAPNGRLAGTWDGQIWVERKDATKMVAAAIGGAGPTSNQKGQPVELVLEGDGTTGQIKYRNTGCKASLDNVGQGDGWVELKEDFPALSVCPPGILTLFQLDSDTALITWEGRLQTLRTPAGLIKRQ